MDRLFFKRGLITLGGMALLLAATGCRHKNLQVPPPTHYSNAGATAPGAETYPPTAGDPAAIDPYSGVGYGATDPTAGATGYGTASASTGAYGYDPSVGATSTTTAGAYNNAGYGNAGYGANAGAAIGSTSDPYATAGAATDPYAAAGSAGSYAAPMASGSAGVSPMTGATGTAEAAPAAADPAAVPPIPDGLPEMAPLP